MQFDRSLNISEIIKNGYKSYKSSFLQFFKYALLVILVSHTIQIISTFLDTFLNAHAVVYIVLTSLIFLLVIPIAYLSIRLNMTAARKYKAIVEKQPFDFKEEYRETKHDFWRMFTVLATKFALKFIILVAMLPIILQIFIYVGFEGYGSDLFHMYIIIPSILIVLFLTVVLIRVEFATYSVYWKIDSDYTDLNTSIRMTKKQFWPKLIAIVIARIPSLVVSSASLLVIAYNTFGDTMMKWGFLFAMISLNLIILSWPISIYYQVFKELKAFKLSADVLVDDDGKEWLTF